MMRWATESCHGLMDLHTCARCSLDGLFNRPGKNGIWNILAQSTRTLSNLLGSLPPSLGTLLGELNFEGGSWTALRMTELVRLRHASVRSMFSEVDQIIAVCQWVKDVLTCNGVDPQKITLCRQGITDQRQTIALNQAQHGSSLNIAFLGRLDPTKGVHILIQALRSLLSDPFRLVIYGVVHGEPGQRYERELRRLAAGDERIEFHSPIRTAEVVSTVRDFD